MKRPGEKTHGMSRTRFYRIWVKMLLRCRNQNDTHYPYYGGRGIRVCKRWEKFENFKKDMFSSYKKELTLDRVDSNKGYCKNNCRWATRKQQSRNSSANVIYKGEYAVDVSVKLGGLPNMVSNRLYLGWSIEDAFTIPKYGRPTSR